MKRKYHHYHLHWFQMKELTMRGENLAFPQAGVDGEKNVVLFNIIHSSKHWITNSLPVAFQTGAMNLS
jgi:hypothetical protein